MAKDFRKQLYFFEDRTFDFVRRELAFSCLVERTGDKLARAWKHFYSCELAFPGYKKAPAAMVTPGFGRDIILDIFNKVPQTTTGEVTKKPTTSTLKSWIATIATNMRQIYRGKRKSNTMNTWITFILMGVLVVQVITWLIIWARQNYGG